VEATVDDQSSTEDELFFMKACTQLLTGRPTIENGTCPSPLTLIFNAAEGKTLEHGFLACQCVAKIWREPKKEWHNKAPERTSPLPRNGYLIIWQSPHSERSHNLNDHLWQYLGGQK
jgi:hypothetical protein